VQGPQSIQVQGIKRFAQSALPPASTNLITKKVIIATINGTQRILTPVSSPQMIALKSAPRLLADGTLVAAGPHAAAAAPITILQKTLSQEQAAISKPKPMPMNGAPTVQTKTVDNKTCRWKFENGQVGEPVLEGTVPVLRIWIRRIRMFFGSPGSGSGSGSFYHSSKNNK
jgi:hypothetical protein